MKIATLNYHNAYNYGAVLQAQALQHIIEEIGHDCDIIDYRNEAVERQYQLRKIRFDKSLIRNLRANLVLLPFIRKKKNNFQNWMSNYKKTSTLRKCELMSLEDRYDRFIVGSDQVWNMKCHNSDTTFFLDFVNDDRKKVAYAASFGTFDIPKKDIPLMQKYIPSFSSISVREERGINLVKELCGRNVIVTMDPVALVGKEYWESKASKLAIAEKFIFVYQLGHGELLPQYVKKLKKKLGLKVFFVTGHIGNMIHYSLGDRNYSSASPEVFLALLTHSDFIVTNSFHATVLAVLFHKHFQLVVKGNSKDSYNSRIYSFLKEYGLDNRITDTFDELESLRTPDFSVFDDKFIINKELSLNYLKQAIEKC